MKTLLVSFLILFLCVTTSFAQSNRLSWFAFSSGMDVSKSQSLGGMTSIVGQMAIGTASYQNVTVKSGFLVDTLFAGTVVFLESGNALPSSFELHQNYPNPFNPVTTIQVDIPKHTYVTLVVYDLLGRQVASLVNEIKDAGRYKVRWTAKNNDDYSVSSGVYFYRLRADEYIQTKKLILLR